MSKNNNDKVYRVRSTIGRYPDEIKVYNPRDKNDNPPEWLTDILKLERFDNGVPIYQKSVDKNGITYQVPSINGHLSIPDDCIIAYNVDTEEVFPIRIEAFNILYQEKDNSNFSISDLFRKLMSFLKKD